MRKTDKIAEILLVLSNIAFLLLYLILANNDRLAIDDFYFLGNLNEYGIIEGTIKEYNTWSTRWISVGLNYLILSLNKQVSYGLFLFNLLNLTLFIGAVTLLIKGWVNLVNEKALIKYSTHNFSLNFSFWKILNSSIFIVSVLFIASIRIDETWFWLCATCTYLWSNMMLLYGIAWLINPNKSIFRTVLGSFSFLYIGGASGPLALIVLLLLMLGFISTYFYEIFNESFEKAIKKRLIVAFLSCLIAFIILYLGNGNRIREQSFKEISLIWAFVLNIKMTGIVFLKRLPYVIIYMLLFTLPLVKWSSRLNFIQPNKNWKKQLLYVTIGYFMVVFLYQFPITYKTQDVGAYRALFPITIATLGYISYVFITIGKNIKLTQKVRNSITIFPLMIAVILFTYQLFQQYTITEKYTKAYDERMIILQNYNQSPVLELEKLPPSGMLFSGEISPNPLHFSNQHLQYGLGLKYQVKLKKEK